jgi:hypothetical protein
LSFIVVFAFVLSFSLLRLLSYKEPIWRVLYLPLIYNCCKFSNRFRTSKRRIPDSFYAFAFILSLPLFAVIFFLFLFYIFPGEPDNSIENIASILPQRLNSPGAAP